LATVAAPDAVAGLGDDLDSDVFRHASITR